MLIIETESIRISKLKFSREIFAPVLPGGELKIIDMSYLKAGKIYWDDWRFLPWSNGTASGLYRRADFIRTSLIGEVGRYQADDYVVWCYEEDDVDRIFSLACPQKSLMLQRFLFLQPSGKTFSKNKAFSFGFRGYAEAFSYVPLTSAPKRYRDLVQLVDASHKYYQAHGAGDSVQG